MISEGVTDSRPQPRERGITLSLGEYRHQIGLCAVLLLAAALNFIGLSKEGYGNTYYAAAVRSMSENWHAFFFNSLDPAGFVSLDKPPLGFWLQVASVKIFGYHGFALMLPQAVAGVLSVGLLYGLVGRVFGRAAGFIAALAAPATWSVTSVQAANTGITPRAGPGNAAGLPGSFGGANGRNGARSGFRPPLGGAAGPPPGFQPPNGGPGGAAGFGPPGAAAGGRGGAGPAGGSSVNTKLLRYLERNQGKAVYLLATTNAGTAEPYIIATGKPVMAMGGFTGSDPILTSSKLASLVKRGVVRFFMLGGGGPGGGRAGGESSITSWVQSSCSLVPSSKYSSATTTSATSTSTRFGGGSLYDCG